MIEKTGYSGVEYKLYGSFRWKIFGKKVIPSKVLPLYRLERNFRKFLYHLSIYLVPGSNASNFTFNYYFKNNHIAVRLTLFNNTKLAKVYPVEQFLLKRQDQLIA